METDRSLDVWGRVGDYDGWKAGSFVWISMRVRTLCGKFDDRAELAEA